MKKLCLACVMLASFSLPAFAGNYHRNNDDTLTRPYNRDTYGPGINSDATGRPFHWETNDGQAVAPGTRVDPDGYGYGVGRDEYGRAVKPKID